MSLSLDDRSLEDLVDDDLLREFGLFFPHERLNEVRRLIQRLVAAVHTAQEDQELLKLCAIWLFHHGKTEDIPLLWKAKESSFDNHFIIDSYLLCGAGLQTTFDFVADSNIADTRGDSSERFTGSHYRPVGVGASNPASVETLLETPGVELASASLALDDHEDHTPTYDSELSSVSDSSKSFLFAGVGIVLLLAAVGGFFWWKQRSASDDNNSIVVVVPSRRAVSRQRSRRPQVTSRRPMPSPPVARRASLTPRRKALVARPARLPSPTLRRKAPQRVAVAPIARIRRPRRRARTRTGSVQVVMTPRCQLYKGQRSLGWTPRVVTQLRPGRHVLRCVNKKKFFNHSFAVEIKAGRRIVVRKEVRKGSFVAFANHWGKIVVKGFGKIGTTQQIKSLYAGRYTLLVFHGNKQRYKIIKLVIRPGKRQKIKVKW